MRKFHMAFNLVVVDSDTATVPSNAQIIPQVFFSLKNSV